MKYDTRKRNPIFALRQHPRPANSSHSPHDQRERTDSLTRRNRTASVYEHVNFTQQANPTPSSPPRPRHSPSPHSLPIRTKPALIRPLPSLSMNSGVVNQMWRGEGGVKQRERVLVEMVGALYGVVMRNNRRLARLEEIEVRRERERELERKVELLLNTMRNVYEGLRIARLKQDNLELYFQPESEPHDSLYAMAVSHRDKHHNQTMKESRLDNGSNHQDKQIKSSRIQDRLRKDRESQELLSLLQTNSAASFDDKCTFRLQQPHQTSPFQLQPHPLHHQSHQHQTSNHSNNFNYHPSHQQSHQNQRREEDNLKKWLCGERAGQCWVDELGCLRRPNMTYVFDPTGSVLTLPSPIRSRLLHLGLIRSPP